MPIDRDKILQTAQKLVDKKRYDKAIVEYQKIVADDPGDVRTLLKIGDLRLKLEKYEDAISTYEQVGEYYYREGFSVKAIAVYKQIRGIIKRHATHLEARYSHIAPRLAEIYTQLGLTSDALAAYDEVASRLRQEGRERDALDIFKKVLDLDPQNPIAHLRVADSYSRLGDIGKAVERFGEASRIMVKLGRVDDALKVLERLLEYRQEPQYARTAAELYLGRNGPNDGLAALAKLQLCFKADPKDLVTLSTLARAFDLMAQPKKAIEVLKEAARVAREKRDDAAFQAIYGSLVERAPDDPLVRQLDPTAQAAAQAAPAVEVSEVGELSDEELASVQSAEPAGAYTEPPPSTMDEIMELQEGELQPVETDVGDLFGAPRTSEPSAVRRLVQEADALHARGKLEQAINLLRDALRNLGTAPTLRQKLSDLLLEWGDQEACIQQKLHLAKELAQAGNLDGALGMLDEILLLQPEHPEAQQMRWTLGYGARTAQAVAQTGAQGVEDLELNAPLQSYDLEAGSVDQLLGRGAHGGLGAMDEPFGADQNLAVAQPSVEGGRPYLPPAAPSLRQLDEDALDQADGLAHAGRFEEARAVLAEQLRMLPNHPLILERMAEIEELAATAQGAVVLPPAEPSFPQTHEAGFGVDDGGYGAEQAAFGSPPGAPSFPSAPDLGVFGASIEQAAPTYGAYGGPPGTPAEAAVPPPVEMAAPPAAAGAARGAAPGAHQPGGYVDVNDVLEQFREGIRKQIDEGDAQTHYDLGVAYNEMGLHSDAISELTLAARDPKRECVCLSLIGSIHLQNGDVSSALDAFHRALNAEQKTAEQQQTLAYEIANAYEMNAMPEQALHYFEWLATYCPDYDDPRGSVGERVQALRSGSGAQRRPLPPAGEGDNGDVESALDEMFGKG